MYSVHLEPVAHKDHQPIVWVARLFDSEDADQAWRSGQPYLNAVTVVRTGENTVEAKGLIVPVSISQIHAFRRALYKIGVTSLVIEHHDSHHKHKVEIPT